MKAFTTVFAMLCFVALTGCSAIRAEGKVCFNPEFLKIVPVVGDNPEYTKERCVGGQVGGQALAPASAPAK